VLRQKSRGLHSHPFISSSYIVIANAPNIAIRQYSKANLGLVLNCLNVYSFSYNLRVEKIFGRTCVVIHFRLHLLFLHKILLNARFDCANTFRESFTCCNKVSAKFQLVRSSHSTEIIWKLEIILLVIQLFMQNCCTFGSETFKQTFMVYIKAPFEIILAVKGVFCEKWYMWPHKTLHNFISSE